MWSFDSLRERTKGKTPGSRNGLFKASWSVQIARKKPKTPQLGQNGNRTINLRWDSVKATEVV
jgi:hypothetical protein